MSQLNAAIVLSYDFSKKYFESSLISKYEELQLLIRLLAGIVFATADLALFTSPIYVRLLIDAHTLRGIALIGRIYSVRPI